MVDVHGARALRLAARTGGVSLEQLIVVGVDVGKSSLSAMACGFTGQVLVAPCDVVMDRDGIARHVRRVTAALPPQVGLVRVGVEAAGHYHLPVTAAGVWPDAW